jgi:hypothetical protein
VKRSGREKKSVSYVPADEREGRRGRKGQREGDGSSRAIIESSVRRRGRKADSTRGQPPVPVSSTRNLRPRQQVNYAEEEPEVDGYIWCTPCGRAEYNGCERHPPFFGDNKEFRLVVEPSGVKDKGVGDGVFNRGKVIPEGVYSGTFISSSMYKEIEKAKLESGNAWEVRDKENKHTVGFMDPGVNPEPQLHWMSKINCPSQEGQQNLVGFQLEGQIYYRVVKDIIEDTELLVYYGDTYATNLGIKVDVIDRYNGKENHAKDVSKCGYCNTGLDGEVELVYHLGKGDNGSYRCGVKQSTEMVRMAETGERKHVCQVCGKGFQSRKHLSQHSSVHLQLKASNCDVDGCNKSYTYSSGLAQHKKEVHEGVQHECYECGRRFGHKHHMSRHIKQVHLE